MYCDFLCNVQVFLPIFNPGFVHVVLDFFLMLLDAHGVDGCEEHRLPLFLETFTSRNQPTLDDRV